MSPADIAFSVCDMRDAHAHHGGGCLITVRDYAAEERGTNLVKPYGIRIDGGKRYLLFQVWDFDGAHYDLSFFITEEHLASGKVKSHVMRFKILRNLDFTNPGN